MSQGFRAGSKKGSRSTWHRRSLLWELVKDQLKRIPWRLDPMTYHVVVAQEFFIEEVAEGDDLESVLAQVQKFISRHGVTLHLEPVNQSDDEENVEPTSVEWNPFPALVAGRN